jgi:hypothetical protein
MRTPQQHSLREQATRPAGLINTAERLSELAELLAAGLARNTCKSSPLSADCGEGSLDFTVDRSGHAPTKQTGERA